MDCARAVSGEAVEALEGDRAAADREAQLFVLLLESLAVVDAAVGARLLALFGLVDLGHVESGNEFLCESVLPWVTHDESWVIVLAAVAGEQLFVEVLLARAALADRLAALLVFS